jgi:hypothetical protein
VANELQTLFQTVDEASMETTCHEMHCLHCAAVLPSSDLADGWCSACGKRLPSSIQASRSYAATLPAGDPEAGLDLNRLVCGGVIIVLTCLVAGIFVFGALS